MDDERVSNRRPHRAISALTGVMVSVWLALAGAQVDEPVSLYQAMRDGRAAVTVRVPARAADRQS